LNIDENKKGLHQAVIQNNIEKVHFLIKSGICLDRTDINCDTPLDLAIKYDRLEIFEILLNSGAMVNASTIANITECDGLFQMEMLSRILERGIDVNIKLEDGETLLMFAAREGNLKIVKRLVELGADINSISRQADFALLNAGSQRHQDVFDYLAPKTVSSLKELAVKRLPTRFAKQLNY
jgi:ankyrin repeat protein